MSGQWPPEWEDQDEEFSEEPDATALAPGDEARLSEVAAFLASVPVPALPDAFEARISAALAAEAATRADHAAPAGRVAPADHVVSAGRVSVPGPSRAPERAGRHRGSGPPRRRFRLSSGVTASALVACLLFAVLGYALSRGGSTASSSYSSAAAPAAGSGAESSSAAAASASGSSAASSAAGPAVVPSAALGAPEPAETAAPSSSFAVTASGTKYQQATLAKQVRTRLAASGGHLGFGASAAPSPALAGCVLQVTDGAVPRLVDRATYQGEPAYVIASTSQVWVVGLGCTAAKTELITSVPLAGLPGNLRALVSVEQQRRTS